MNEAQGGQRLFSGMAVPLDPEVLLGWESLIEGRRPVEQALVRAVLAATRLLDFQVPRPGPTALPDALELLFSTDPEHAGVRGALPGQVDIEAVRLHALNDVLLLSMGSGDAGTIELAAEAAQRAELVAARKPSYAPMVAVEWLLVAEHYAEQDASQWALVAVGQAIPRLIALGEQRPDVLMVLTAVQEAAFELRRLAAPAGTSVRAESPSRDLPATGDRPPGEPFDQVVAELGIAPRDASAGVRLLKGEVADLVCRLLPGIEHSTAPRWLWTCATCLLQVTPGMAADQYGTRELRPEQARLAICTATYVLVIAAELMLRHDAAHPELPLSQRRGPLPPPEPSGELRGFRRIADASTRQLDHLRPPLATMLRQAAGEPAEAVWGGWALLAAYKAIEDRQDRLPKPRPPGGSGRLRRGTSALPDYLQVGRRLTLTSAVSLLGKDP